MSMTLSDSSFNKQAVENFAALIAEIEAVKVKEESGDSLFRIAYSTHLSLSRVADHKAHFMLGINTFVLSSVVTKKKMGFLAHIHAFVVPDILLVLMCMTCIILAILATRPGISPPARKKKSINWLFFGDYSQFSLMEFDQQLNGLMMNPEARQEAFSRDLYWLGVSLHRKYRYLALCYQVFYTGLIVITIAFGIALIFKA
ncbi:MAG: Pycsar system effector family protein [Bacteroidota bacterium]